MDWQVMVKQIGKTAKWFMRLSSYSIALIFGWMLLMVSASLPGQIEGRYAPVISDVAVGRIDRQGRLYGTMSKLRDCDFVSLQWVAVRENNKADITVMLFDPEAEQIVRTVGDNQLFGPWQVNIPQQLLPGSQIRMTHRCHALFNTVTTIEPVIDALK